MEYTKFYINRACDSTRKEKFDETWIRAPAVDYKDLQEDNVMFERMVSMWNINPQEHKAKTACFMSHYNLLRKISDQQLDRCIIVEDDAIEVNELPDPVELGNEFCYLGGYFSHLKMTQGALKEVVSSHNGLNQLNRDTHRLLMTVAYYIPHHSIATKIVEFLDSKVRIRAIDVMLHSIPCPVNYYYPARFVESDELSTIRPKKRQHPNSDYLLV